MQQTIDDQGIMTTHSIPGLGVVVSVLTAASMIGCARSTVSLAIKRGDLYAIQTHNSNQPNGLYVWWVSKSSVEAYIRQGKKRKVGGQPRKKAKKGR